MNVNKQLTWISEIFVYLIVACTAKWASITFEDGAPTAADPAAAPTPVNAGTKKLEKLEMVNHR